MSEIICTYSHDGVTQEDVAHISRQMEPHALTILSSLNEQYESPYASLHVPFDTANLDHVEQLIDLIKKLEPTVLIVIGIGGSNLGTMAVHQALFGTMYNELQPALRVYYADTVDTDHINDLICIVQQELEKEHAVIVNLVTKSGATTESIANFNIFTRLLASYYGDSYHHYIVVTTDEGSKLELIARERKYHLLSIPQMVGGRYSVLTSVGLFPLGMLGVPLKQLCAGAATMLLDIADENHPARISAATIFAYYDQGLHTHNMFPFAVDLASLGAWYRQLVGESLGKERLNNGTVHPQGILPITSIGSTDLHSMVQYYLAAPPTMFTTFISVHRNESDLIVDQDNQLERLVPHIGNKRMKEIMDAIEQGTLTAYREKSRPFMHMMLPEKNAYVLGQFLQWKMIEVIYLGLLMDIDPFDQPQVELYKKATRKILAHE